MDKKIIVSLFESYERAHGTADRLEAAGFDHDDISVIDRDSARTRSWAGSPDTFFPYAGAAYPPAVTGAPGYPTVPAADTAPALYPALPAAGLVVPAAPAAGVLAPAAGAVGGGGTGIPPGGTSYASDKVAVAGAGDIAEWLSGEGVDEDDAHAYAEGVRRGGTLLAVKCGETDVDRVVSIIDNNGALDIDERQSAWRGEGWAGREQTAHGRDIAGTERGITPAAGRGLHGGQGQPDHGRVRIHSPRATSPNKRSEP